MEYSKKDIEQLFQRIFDGDVSVDDLPEDLYLATADYLKKALYKGFGGSLEDFEGKDFELLSELRENIYMFSAAKTYQQISDICDALTKVIDEGDGFKEFREAAGGIFDQYNENYLKTEYTTAIGQAQSAAHWNKIDKQKEVLPYLRYSATGGEQVCDICGECDGVILPVDDPFWDQFMPVNHFNCMCTVEQLSEDAKDQVSNDDDVDVIVAKVEPLMSDVFKMNPGKDKVIFSEDHPYFDVDKKDVNYARNNFDLPIPKTDEDDE